MELNERGALDSVGSLFGGGGSLSNRCLSRGSLNDRLDCRLGCNGCLGGNLCDGLNNRLCNRFGNDRLRSGRFGNSGLGQCGLSNYSLFNCGRLGRKNLLGQSSTCQRNLSQVTHRLRLRLLSGLLNGLNRGRLNLLCLNVGCLSCGCCSCGCGSLRNLNDLLTFELSGELLQVNVLNGQRCRSLGGLLSLNSGLSRVRLNNVRLNGLLGSNRLSDYRLNNLLSGSCLSSGLLGNQRLNSSLFNLNGFGLGLFDPQLPTFRNGTPRGVGAPRRSGGPSGRRSGPVGRRIEDECHKKAAFLVLKKHPGRAVISDYVYERIVATNYGIGSEHEPRE